MQRMSGAPTAIALAVLIAVAGCGGPAVRSFDGTTYRDGPIAFQVPPKPASWRAVEVTDASLAYRDETHGASILVNARCHRPDEGTPLVALTNHLLMGSTAREVVSQEVEPFDGREALHTKMRAKWDGVPIAFDIYVAKKDGCIYDFVYMGDPAAFDAGAREFEGFVRGFRTLPQSGTVSFAPVDSSRGGARG
jgi:hypothetical protein